MIIATRRLSSQMKQLNLFVQLVLGVLLLLLWIHISKTQKNMLLPKHCILLQLVNGALCAYGVLKGNIYDVFH